MFSTVPGFGSPNASLRWEKDVYVSAKAATIELLKRNARGDSFSSAIDDMMMWQLLSWKMRQVRAEEAGGGNGGVRGGDRGRG